MPTTRLTVLEPIDRPRGVTTRLRVTSGNTDAVQTDLTVAGYDIMGQSARSIDFELEMDRGNGILVPVTKAELGGTLTLRGSLEGYGVRELEFQLLGRQSPLLSAELRGARRVRLVGVRGVPGGRRRTPMFDGHIRSASFDLKPNATRVIAQEGALVLKPLFYVLAPRSGRTRDSVIREICEQNDAKVGTLAWANNDGGGYVMHEINETGDRNLLQVIAELTGPTGHRVYQERDPRFSDSETKLCIARLDPSDASARTFTFADIHGPFNVLSPEVDVPNVVRLAASLYPYVGPERVGTTVTTVSTTGSYTPAKAANKQNHLTGAITAITPSVALQSELTRTVTTDSYVAGALAQTTVERWAWRAERACNKRLNADGSSRYNDAFDVFLFADGTWRYREAEIFQVVETTYYDYTYNPATGILQAASIYDDCMHSVRTPIAQLNGALAEVPITDTYVLDDGSGWLNGHETTHRADITQGYGIDPATKQLIHVTGQIYRDRYGSFPFNATFLVVVGLVNGCYVFGPTAAKTYGSRVNASSPGVLYESWQTVYTNNADGTHRAVTARVYLGTYVGAADRPGPYAAADVTADGRRPLVTYSPNLMPLEPNVIESSDEVRIALNHGYRNQVSIESSWCETPQEMETLALEELRRHSRIGVPIDTDVDWELGEGDVVTLPPHPDLAPGAQKVLVLSSEWTLDYMGHTNAQTLGCIAYPPEVT
jgi:hypothetical protein